MSRIVVDQLKQSVIEAAWIQWRSLGSFIDIERLANSMVDPEALLLVSLTLRHDERRFWDILASWAKSGSKLFSVQRVKNLQKGFPGLTQDRLAEFAFVAKKDGGDFRWKNLAGPEAGPPARNQGLWQPYPSVWESSALLIRLRLGFGVGIVPDLLGFLISLEGDWAGVRLISKATGFSAYSIRRTADNMVASRLLESTPGKPVEYRVKTNAWCNFLNIDDKPPSWRFWYQIYFFVTHVIHAVDSGEWDGLSPYLLSSRLRDLLDSHQDAFSLNHNEIPDPTSYPGEKYLSPFNDTLSILANWIKQSV